MELPYLELHPVLLGVVTHTCMDPDSFHCRQLERCSLGAHCNLLLPHTSDSVEGLLLISVFSEKSAKENERSSADSCFFAKNSYLIADIMNSSCCQVKDANISGGTSRAKVRQDTDERKDKRTDGRTDGQLAVLSFTRLLS